MRSIITPTLLLALAPAALADNDAFTSQVTPSFRGEPGARYDGYDAFTQASILPNFADLAGSCAGSTITQLDPAAILTSTGNIYSFATVTDFVLELADGDVLGELVLQTRSLGNVLDPGSFALLGTDSLGNPVSLAPASVVTLSTTMPGEVQLVWDAIQLGGLGLSDASVTFNASGESCSLDVVLVDYRVDRLPLETDTETISVAAGGTQNLDLDAGADRAGDLYLVLGSASGTAPGFAVGGVVLPLVADGYTDFTLASANAGVFSGTFGNLDGCGRATASIVLPGGSDAALAGLALNHAFLTIDTGTFAPDFASNASPLNLVD